MATMYLAYYGEFIDRKDGKWRVEIRKEWYGADRPPEDSNAKEVFFSADKPLAIEWGHTEKYEPLQASSATLKLISESDREFVDLYAVKAGSVRLDIMVPELHGNVWEWVVYWSGTLDTELYEEPYSYSSDYEVQLTFADFGILDRLDYTLSGFKTFEEIMLHCLSSAGLKYRSIRQHISTQQNNERISLSDLSVRSDNFYDEEGKPMRLREVLSAILQPLALRIIQRRGYIYVYDLAWMYAQTAKAIFWNGTDAVMAIDSIYNNVSVNYSPYDDSKALHLEINTKEELSAVLDDNVLIRMNYQDQGNEAINGFRMFYGPDLEGSSELELSANVQYIKIEPIFSGEEATAVLWGMRRGDVGMAEAGEPGSGTQIVLVGSEPGLPAVSDPNGTTGCPLSSGMVFKCPRVFLAGYNGDLRLTMELLFDVRYNPFEDATYGNESGNYDNMKDWCNFGYVPIILNFVAEDGTVIGHYDNSGMLNSDGYGGRDTLCKWVDGPGAAGNAWLAYYNNDNRKDDTGFGGWQTNKQIIGYYRDSLPKRLTVMEQGEYIDSPARRFNQAGYLELTILAGVLQFDYNREIKNIYPSLRWLAYKIPEIVLVDTNGIEIDSKDYEDSAHLNLYAREELSLDFVVGSRGLPSAKALMFYKGKIIQQASRGGITDTLPRLLIGTIYSQYAAGCIKLSGTSEPLDGPGPYLEASTEGKFIALSEVVDVRAVESKIEVVELMEENYTAVDYA